MPNSKDTIQHDDTIQIRKTHGAFRAESYTLDELNEFISKEEDAKLTSLELRAPETSENAPQMMVLATADGTKNPDMELTSALPGALGNNVEVSLAFYEETVTRDKIEFVIDGTTLLVSIPATMSEDEIPVLVTSKTLGDLITAWSVEAAALAVVSLKAAGNDGAKLAEETVKLKSGVDALLALPGKQISQVSALSELEAIWLCILETTHESDTLAEHWIDILPDSD